MTYRQVLWQKLALAEDEDEFKDYQSTWLLRLCRRTEEIIIFLLLKVPPLYKAFVEGSERWVVLRKVTQFSFGLFLGLLFYLVIVVDLQLEPVAAKLLGLTICLFAAIGNVVSAQVRCISFLLPLRFGGQSGRSVLMALIIVYVSAGPVTNIMANLKECIRVIVCQMTMTFSLLKTKYEMMFKPLQSAISQARGTGNEGKEMISVVEDVLTPLQDELQNETEARHLKEENDYIDNNWGESKRSQETERRNRIFSSDDEGTTIKKQYVKKMEYRCDAIMTNAYRECAKKFNSTYRICIQTLPGIVDFICPYLSLTFICNSFRLSGGDTDAACQTKEVVDPDTGSTYESMRKNEDLLKEEFLNTHLQYKMVEIPSEAKEVADDMYDAGRKIFGEFKNQKSTVDIFIILIMRCTAFSFIFLIINCNKYISNYLNDIEADNQYITLYFRRVDYRRHIKGKLTLLPLKTAEKRSLSDVYEFRLTEDEMGELSVHKLSPHLRSPNSDPCTCVMWFQTHALSSTIILFLFSLLFMLIDNSLYTILDDLNTYGRIMYTQVGHHDLEYQVKGIGFLASVIRSIAGGFSVKQRINRIFTNEECWPRPSNPGKYNFKILGSFALLFLFAIMNAWVLKRANRYICSIFFPKAEKTRIIYLYNEHLKKRITFLNYRLDIARLDARKRISDDLTFYRVLRLKYPRWFGWLGYFKGGSRRKCLICQEYEPKSGGDTPCIYLNCYAYYDQQCWNFVVKQKCIGCPRYKDNVVPSEDL